MSGMQHLERNETIVPKIARKIDRGHSSATDLALHREAVGQRLLQPGRDVGHWRAPRLRRTRS